MSLTNAQLRHSASRPFAVGRATPQRAGASWTLTVAAAGTFLVLAVFASTPATIGDSVRALHAGVAGATWGLSGMSLGLAAALLTLGALADDLGRRRVLGVSAAVLALTNVAAALAPSMAVLVLARVLQGVAGAGVITASLGAIGEAFPSGHPRTHATAVWGAALGAGIAAGPVFGAAVAGGWSWRGSYWLQALAAAALVPAAGAVAESRAPVRRGIDWVGAVVLSAGMAGVVAGLVEGRSSWSAPATIVLLVAGTGLLVLFAAIELARGEPMLDLRQLGHPTFVASLSGALFTGLALIGLMSYSPTVMHSGLDLSIPASAGVLAIWSTTSVVFALVARRLPAKLASHVRLAIGLALAAVGELALTRLGAGSSWTALVPGLFVAGVGSGFGNAALGRLAVESVRPEQAGMGSGANNTARYLGGAAGVALVVAVASAGGGHGAALLRGWDHAALISAVLCAVGALVAVACRPSRTR